MISNFTEDTWKRALDKDKKLKDLAMKACVVNNFKRAKELNGCFQWNCGEGVVKTKEEYELAKYMFCVLDSDVTQSISQERIQIAHSAGIETSNL